MTNFTSLLRQGLLALALAATALGAMAAPTTYLVNFSTAGMEAGTLLEFGFSSDPAVAASTATVSNLNGNFIGGAGGAFTLTNLEGGDFVDLSAVFGGPFSFNVTFSDGFMAGPDGFGSRFAVSVVDDSFNPVPGGAGVVLFDLFPESGITPNVAAGVDGRVTLVAPNAVPEPSSLLMLMTGLGLVGFTARRRKSPAA